MLIFTFFVVCDLLVWFGWILFYCIDVIHREKLYREYHFDLIAHLLGTLRAVNIVEQEWRARKAKGFVKLSNFLWNLATFSFALLFDVFNVVHYTLFLNDAPIYGPEMVFGIIFITISALYIAALITKRVMERSKIEYI